MNKFLFTLATGLALTLCASSVRAGAVAPFTVEAKALAIGFDSSGSYSEIDVTSSAAMTPVTAQGSQTGVASNASATFTEFKAFARNDLVSGSNARADAEASDTLTIDTAGSPVGTTRLEMTWQIDGTLSGSGDQSATFSSDYRIDTSGSGHPNLTAGTNSYTTNGSINESVTFVYDNVPLNSPWNVFTELTVQVEAGPGESDFDNTATLTGVTLFVNDIATPALVTGLSGQTYAVPEPASAALLALGGLALRGRRRRGC